MSYRLAKLTIFSIVLSFLVFPSGVVWSDEFYRGKSVRIIVPYSPGGGSDTISRLIGRLISKHIPGNPSIVVMNITGAGGIVGLNYLYNIAKPDGLTIAHTSVPGVRDQTARTSGVKHDYNYFEYLGSAGPSSQMFTIRRSLPYETFEDLKKAGKQLFVAGSSPASTPNIVGRILEHEGVNLKVVSGYRGSSIRVAAMIKGEMDASTLGVNLVVREKQHLKPIFWIEWKGPQFPDLPMLGELPLSAKTRSFIKAVTTPLLVGRTFLAPPKTPKDRLAVLQRAFEKTVKSSEFLAAAKRLNVPIQWRNAEETKALQLEVLKTPPKGVAALREILGLTK